MLSLPLVLSLLFLYFRWGFPCQGLPGLGYPAQVQVLLLGMKGSRGRRFQGISPYSGARLPEMVFLENDVYSQGEFLFVTCRLFLLGDRHR